MQCVKEPPKPLYGGGIISGSAEAPAPSSPGGKKLLMAKSTSAPVKGSVLKVELKKDHHYALSGNTDLLIPPSISLGSITA